MESTGTTHLSPRGFSTQFKGPVGLNLGGLKDPQKISHWLPSRLAPLLGEDLPNALFKMMCAPFGGYTACKQSWVLSHQSPYSALSGKIQHFRPIVGAPGVGCSNQRLVFYPHTFYLPRILNFSREKKPVCTPFGGIIKPRCRVGHN